MHARIPLAISLLIAIVLALLAGLAHTGGGSLAPVSRAGVEADFGDAPESDELFICTGVPNNYPSRLANNGPYHMDLTDSWVGPIPNTATLETDAVLPNCDDWFTPPMDDDDGCLILFIPPVSGWMCFGPPGGGGVFGSFPGAGCHEAVWVYWTSVSASAPDVDRFANVVADDNCSSMDAKYGPDIMEWVAVNVPLAQAAGTSVVRVSSPLLVDTELLASPPHPPGSWTILPFWTRFQVSEQAQDPAAFAPDAWDGSGPPGGYGFGETEDWLVVGDPGDKIYTEVPRHGDGDCDGRISAVDALQILRRVAGLSHSPCARLGGDLNCDSANTSVDALLDLRDVAGLPVNVPDGCPQPGNPFPLPTNLPTMVPTPTPSATQTPSPTPCADDHDCDGFADGIEEALGSDPNDPQSTPENVEVPQTCADGIDNDLDGDTDAADTGCQHV